MSDIYLIYPLHTIPYGFQMRWRRLEAVIASLGLPKAPPVATANMASTAGIKPNRSFGGGLVFLGDHGQSFRLWSTEFMAKAGMVTGQCTSVRAPPEADWPRNLAASEYYLPLQQVWCQIRWILPFRRLFFFFSGDLINFFWNLTGAMLWARCRRSCANDDVICVITSAIEDNYIPIEQLTVQSAAAHRPASLGRAGMKIATLGTGWLPLF